ncbi:MAG: hypothetical protein U0U67_11005 [Chitinophagales bacterium]
MPLDLNKLKSLFIVEDTTEKTETEKTEQTTTQNTTVQTTVVPGNVDQTILDTLFKSLSDNNLQGFDYFEYKQSLKTLRGMLDEQTAFKSAFATAATMGITKEKLLETANFYVKVLEKEKEKFDEAARSQGGATIEQKKKEIELTTKSIADKSEQIRKLTDEISAAQTKINELNAFVLQAEAKIADTSKNFIASYNSISSEISTDIEKIKQYIQ